MKTDIKNLGKCSITSPLCKKYREDDENVFVEDDERVIFDVSLKELKKRKSFDEVQSFEQAGPRKKVFFEPSKVKTAIVTCGGLCPGLNDVIRSIVNETYYGYGSHNIVGIPYGYNGLNPNKEYGIIDLTPDMVSTINKQGGTILGSSRGGTDDMEMLVDSLERLNINILYTLGGDGTLKGAHKIAEIAHKRNLKMSVIGIPKTIDNDISFISKTFGFETAFSEAVRVIWTAHAEAKGAHNGIGLVKLMGRHSGFIASNAALAMNDVNFVLIPEEPFDLEGENGFLKHLEKRLERRGHAVICVAEGAGQEIMAKYKKKVEYDASGNVKLQDIGLFLKEKINEYFKTKNIDTTLKYIDPSYIIRSAPATPNDSLFCTILGQNAVHAGMAGKTDMIVGTWNYEFTHLPIELVTSQRKQMDTNSSRWYNVLQATGQPASMKN